MTSSSLPVMRREEKKRKVMSEAGMDKQVNAETEMKDEMIDETLEEKAEEKAEEKIAEAPVESNVEEPAQDVEQKHLTEAEAEPVFEAILFAMGDSVEIGKLAEVAGIDVRTAKKVLKKMEERYLSDDRGIQLTWFESAVQLCTKPETYEYLIKIAKNPKKIVLTDTVIETLSIIAYKQPVTRLDVENIRGVNCDHAINKLLEYDLITELGRLDAPGRPILFGTTEQFLRTFGVKSLEDLPELSAIQMEEFKAQAEAEVKIRLD